MPNVIAITIDATHAFKAHLATAQDQQDFLLLASINPHLDAAALSLAFKHNPLAMEWRTRDEWRARGVSTDELAGACPAPLRSRTAPHLYVTGYLYPRQLTESDVAVPASPWPVVRERTRYTPADAIVAPGGLDAEGLARHAVDLQQPAERVRDVCVQTLLRRWGCAADDDAGEVPGVPTLLTVQEMVEALRVLRAAMTLLVRGPAGVRVAPMTRRPHILHGRRAQA